MQQLEKSDRAAVLGTTATTVETKHFDPNFDGNRWRALVDKESEAILNAASMEDFDASLSGLIRAVGPPESGLVHESQRKKIPKGLAARFQYCQPKECAPAIARASDGGDVMISQLSDGVGWLKVTKFPGAVGIDIAKQIDKAVAELSSCNRLIVDLRGNAGGGLAFLRVMSYLTPDRVPVGYSVTRAKADAGYSKEGLKVFDRIPAQKLALVWLALKFGIGDDSVSLFTEKLGAQPFHRRLVVLVDGETTGAGERIAAFVKERQLGPIVGTKTAGRLICCSLYKVGHGYFVRVPARAWFTWNGELLEDKGVAPDSPVEASSDNEADPQLDRAIEVARTL